MRFGAGDHWSGKLDEWLSAALPSGAYERYVWLDGDIGDDEQDGPDEDETVLEWTDRRRRGVQTWSFPTDDLRSEYLSSVAGRPESEVFALLRLFLLDAIAIIRARWIEDAKSGVEALFHISPRAFELLMAALYLELGYEVVVTPPQRDGGRDVIARKNLAGRSEVVEIECMAHTSAIGVDVVRALRGVVGGNGSNRGVVVTTSRFTRGAVKIAADDHRIELVDGATLVQLLNSVLDGRWIHDRTWICRTLEA